MSEVDEKEKAIGEPLGAVSGPAVNLSEMPTPEASARAREEALGSRAPEKPLVKLKVTFMPMNVVHEIDANETVLHLAQRSDIHIQSVCKGLPSCAECRVCIKEGEHHVPPPSSKELSLIGTAHYIDRSRLSCQLRCYGDIVVDLTEQLEKANRMAKQPQGRASRKEGETSYAVKGSIIETEYTGEDESAPVIEKLNPTEVRPGHDSFYEEPKKNQNQRKSQGGGPDHQNNRNRNNRGGGGGANNRNDNRNDGRRDNRGAQNQAPRNNNRNEARPQGSPESVGNPSRVAGGNPNHNRGGRGTVHQGAPRGPSSGGGRDSRPRPVVSASSGINQGENQGGHPGSSPGSSRPQPRKNPENNG